MGREVATTDKKINLAEVRKYRIGTNNYRLGNFSEKSVLRKDAVFFENNLSGIRSFEIAVTAKENSHINDLENLKSIDKLQNYLSGFDYVGVIFSLVTLYKSINQSYNFGSGENFKLPGETSIKLYDNILNLLRRISRICRHRV